MAKFTSEPQEKKRKSLDPLSRTGCLLLEIGAQIEDMHFTLQRPNLVLKFGIEDARKFLDREEYYYKKKAIAQLEERKLIKTKKLAEKYEITLLKNGIIEYLRLKLCKTELLPEGSFCMVIFDIPESQRSLRKKLRELLSRIGFIPLQRSVWISPFDAQEILNELFRVQGKRRWIRIFTVHEN